MAIIKVKTSSTAKAGLNYGELAIGANELYFGDASDASIKVATDSNVVHKTGAETITGVKTFDTTSIFKNRITLDYSATGGDGTWEKSGILIKNMNATSTETAIAMQNSSTSGNYYWIQGLNQSADYKFAYGTSFTDAATKLTITPDGKVGIGVIAPEATLHIKSTSNQIRLWGDATTGNQNATISFSSASTNSLDISTGYASDANKITLSPRGLTAMTLLGSGNVGIGTITPTQKLDVVGSVVVSANYYYGANAYTKYDSTSKSIKFVFA